MPRDIALPFATLDQVQEHPIPIEDCINVYGDFPEIDTPCDKSPVGQCEYDARRDPERCIHCGRKT